MGEIKSVKVDNWGVFFLQKLQNFFNKTDYCDLTLQFNDNSQLRVHRLVLSACTDFFNVLEQSCEMIDDVLIMPPELQADVVVPIVNFMYTGTLEFELIMYGRLLKTAKDMNMTVLLKLLEAHRRTMENKSQSIQKVAPKQVRRMPYNSSTKVVEERKYITQSQSTSTPQQRRTPVASTVPKYKTLQIKPVSQNIFPRMLSEPAQILSKYPHSKTPVKGPSRFDCAEDTLPPETFEKSFDNISYESKPLICKEEPDAYDYDNLIRKHETYASPFEQLRRSYTNVNNKRPASSLSSYESPPEKKPNIQDVKEYAEQQRMRKQIAEEFDDDQEYDDTLDDEFHNDDDDDEYIPPQSVRKQVKQQQQQFRAQQQAKQAQQQKTGQHTVQIHKTSPKSDNSPRATIVVKDSTSKSLNHAKVICEVLRKYPHIVKNSKSIKLKVMPQSNNAQKIVIRKEIDPNELQVEEKLPASVSAAKQPVPSTSTSNVAIAAAISTTQPRRIDSKTMHALIAMGAENRAGPWLCLRCGVNGRPISIPSYRGFRRHLINVHKEKIDPRLCEHCGWRSTNNKDLTHHLLVEHSFKTEHNYNFPKCEYCNKVCIDYDTLNKHITAKHSVKKEPQACIYCNVSFGEEIQLYTHMRSFHKQRAIEDGVLDFSDEEMSIEDASEVNMQEQVNNDSRINIISDISLSKNLPIIQAAAIPANGSTITIQSAAATTPAASLNIIENTTEEESQMLTNEFIGTDSSQGPKFINAQGTEMELTPAQREEIISQLDQQHDGIVMVLNEDPFEANLAATTTSARTAQNNTEEATSSEPVADNSMFIVCGQEPDMENEISMPASLDRAKSKSKDPLEWVEEEIANHTDSADKETKNDENENEIAKENTEDDAQEKSSEAAPATEAKVEEKEDETKEEQEEVLSPKVASEKPVEDSLEMKLKLLTDWTDDEEEDEDDPEKGKASQSSNVEEEKITSEAILFETLTKDDRPLGDSAKASVKEKTPEAEAKPNVDPEVEEEDGDKMQDEEGAAVIEKEEEKEASPVPEEHEDEEDEAGESKDEEVKEDGGGALQEDEPAEDQEMHEPEEKLTEDWEKKEDSKKDSENAASSSKDDKEERTLITRAELRNIMSDWGDDEEEEV